MNADLLRLGGVIGALGLSALILARARTWRAGALAVWALGCGLLAIELAPSGHHRAYAAAAVAGLAAAGLLALLFVRLPWTLAVAVLACAPARIPIKIGATKANLLLPLYVVVAGAALALAWGLLRKPPADAEPAAFGLGASARPAALLVAWLGLGLLWSDAADKSLRAGAVDLLFYVLPLGLLAVAFGRLRWDIRWVKGLYVQLAAMALAFAAIGIDQYLTRHIYWNPKVIVDNAYAPNSWFYRVNSIFYDPSIYGRFLVVAILASLVLVLFGRGRPVWAAACAATVTLVGLLPSFSQSSFFALGCGIAVALTVLWRKKALLPLAFAVAALAAVTLGVPQLRHRVLGKNLSHATGTRSTLVSTGIKLALHHPLIGLGTGGFVSGYAKETHTSGAASHDAPITVAAENGLPGLALLLWLLAAVFVVPFRGNRVRTATDRARLAFGLALLAIVVHSLFYNALLEDPLFWALLALSAVALREPASA
ncbi:MAG TPA: O-antigen ligase family protein [Gaiellaceae bacterium]|nr:O-antigen ligase family protein [Gaiellaceae bacterium]